MPALLRRARVGAIASGLIAAAVILSGCGGGAGSATSPEPQPEVGACRVLSPADVAESTDLSATVECTEPHTAETFAVGQLPSTYDDAERNDAAVGEWAYDACSTKFQDFVSADDSLVMRTVVSWVWFRPSEAAWDDGARWYRCDIVGGGEQSKEYVDLPTTARGLLKGKQQDRWLVCADGETVSGAVKVACTEPHDWRAVTTITVGKDNAAYPGDRSVEGTTRNFCSKSVAAWLGYPVEYDFGYTWFHRAEWEAGNRRSVCWAKTDQ